MGVDNLYQRRNEMITKEDADNLLYESKENLVDMLCTQSELIDDLYSQLKQRDDEIEMLQCRLYHAEGYIKDIHEPKDTK